MPPRKGTKRRLIHRLFHNCAKCKFCAIVERFAGKREAILSVLPMLPT